MAIRVQTDFIRKATVRIIAYVYDDDGDLADATSVSVSIMNPAGTLAKTAQTMSNTATGTYEYYCTTTADWLEGAYQVEVDVLDGSYHTYATGHFTLVAGINE